VLGNKEERNLRLTARRSGSMTPRKGQLHCTHQEHQLGVDSSSPRTCGIEANRPDVSGRCFGDGIGPQALGINWVRYHGNFMPYQHPG
jgi:hypothetical protein